MARIAVATLGCKVNQCESAGIAEALTAEGMTVVPFEEEADCYIVNTCTVTERSDYQSRQLIRRAIRKNPAASVFVTGCYAQRAPAEIARIPGVRLIAGNTEKEGIPELIRQMAGTQGPQRVRRRHPGGKGILPPGGDRLSGAYPGLPEDPGRLQRLLLLLHRSCCTGTEPEPPPRGGRGTDRDPGRGGIPRSGPHGDSSGRLRTRPRPSREL